MSNISKFLKLSCSISDYEYWDDTIYENALKFHDEYAIHPNILIASKITWDKIDKYANLYHPENIGLMDDDIIDFDEEEIKTIAGFQTSEYSLAFCLDEKIATDHFILVFDEHPTFDGEPIDELENENAVIYQRIA